MVGRCLVATEEDLKREYLALAGKLAACVDWNQTLNPVPPASVHMATVLMACHGAALADVLISTGFMDQNNFLVALVAHTRREVERFENDIVRMTGGG